MDNKEAYQKELDSMFKFNSKIYKLVPKELISNYQELLFTLSRMMKEGTLKTHSDNDYLGGNDLAINIYKKKYFLKNREAQLIESRPEQVFARVAAFVAAIETDPEKRKEYAIKFYNALYDGIFMPGGRVIAGSGDLYRIKTLSNCFVSLIRDDSIEGIFDAARDCARTYSYGGGIGVDISGLRPADSIVHNAADKSTGAVSFMELYSMTTGLIGQSGRRGALMITLDVKHPDAFRFIDTKKVDNWITEHIANQCKWTGDFDDKQINTIRQKVRENIQVRFANISLKVSDEFMTAVEESKLYGDEKILVYKKTYSEKIDYGHYSYEIPSKNIDDYELINQFNTFSELATHFAAKGITLIDLDLKDEKNRDIYGDFIVQSGDETFAIKHSGDFLLYFNSPQAGEIRRLIKAKELWSKFVESNYNTAEPGLIFWSTMTKYSPSNYVGRPIACTNPCGEVPLEDGGACNLTSLNFSRVVDNSYEENAQVNHEKIKQTVRLMVRFLDNVITWNEYLNPLEKQRESAKTTRRIGLGYIGIADMLNQLGLGYDSEEGIAIMKTIAEEIANVAYDESSNLAVEKGVAPVFDYEKYKKGAFFKERLNDEVKEKIRGQGLRNIAILSIAPTGTISNIIKSYQIGNKNYIGVSSGIEPIFALFYTRRTETIGQNFYKVFHSTVQAYIDQKELNEKAQTVKNEDDLHTILPDFFFRTAHHISPDNRIKVQGVCQKYVDHSISSTCNLSEDIEPEVISDVYFKAWKAGLKGITIYRDGSRYAILSVEGKETNFQRFKDNAFTISLGDGKQEELKGNSIIHDNNGVMTTVYHAHQNNISLTSCSWNGINIKEVLSGNIPIQVQETIQKQEEILDNNLRTCPACEKITLKIDGGCSSCVNPECGFSKCDH